MLSLALHELFGCPEGEMRLSPGVYAHFLQSLSQLAAGRVVLMLEGGYFLESLADGVALSLRSLIGGTAIRLGPIRPPKPSVIDTILNVTSAIKLGVRSNV